MKKIFFPVLIFALVLFCAACGGEKLELSVSEAADELNSGINFAEILSALSMDDVIALYGVDSDLVVDAAAYVSSGATAEEISVWQAKDSDGAETIAEMITTRMENQKNDYSSYKPEEVPKLENYMLRVQGEYVALCVTDDIDTAEGILTALGF